MTQTFNILQSLKVFAIVIMEEAEAPEVRARPFLHAMQRNLCTGGGLPRTGGHKRLRRARNRLCAPGVEIKTAQAVLHLGADRHWRMIRDRRGSPPRPAVNNAAE